MKLIKQALRYGVVGLSNTLITAAIIWVMMKVAGCGDLVSNITGYAVGVLNSFVWNRRWTFKDTGAWVGSGIRFLLVFGVCYLLQLLVLIQLNKRLDIDPYYNQLLAMVFYTLINFLLNKYITFKQQKQ